MEEKETQKIKQERQESSMKIFNEYKQQLCKQIEILPSSNITKTLEQILPSHLTFVINGNNFIYEATTLQQLFIHWKPNPNSSKYSTAQFIQYLLSCDKIQFQIKRVEQGNLSIHSSLPSKRQDKKIGSKESDKIKLTSSQLKWLQNYFKYYSRLRQNHFYAHTFDQIQQRQKAMEFAQWMKFNKSLNIVEQLTNVFHNKQKCLKVLKQIFITYQENNQILFFSNFCCAVVSMLQILISLAHDYQFWACKMGIINKKVHIEKLQKIGIVSTNRENIKGKRKINSISTQRKQNCETERGGKDKKKQMPWEKVSVYHLSKMHPDRAVTRSLNRMIQGEDEFLKEYSKKKETIEKGVLNKLGNIVRKRRIF